MGGDDVLTILTLVAYPKLRAGAIRFTLAKVGKYVVIRKRISLYLARVFPILPYYRTIARAASLRSVLMSIIYIKT